MCVAGRHLFVRGLFWSISCYACYPGIVAWVWLSLLSYSFNHWVASYLHHRCDVSCGIRCIVGTVLWGVPSVVVVVSGFYCSRVRYGALFVGCVSWGLCRVLHRACPVRESVSHKQTPVQDRHNGEPGTVPKTHHQQLGPRNPPADNKIQKRQPRHTAQHSSDYTPYAAGYIAPIIDIQRYRMIETTWQHGQQHPCHNPGTASVTKDWPEHPSTTGWCSATHTLSQGRPANSKSPQLIHVPNKPHHTIRGTLYNIANV